MACAQEVGEGALDLEEGAARALLVEGRDGERGVGLGEDMQEVLGEELTIEHVGTVFQEVFGAEWVVALRGEGGHVEWRGGALNGEHERASEVGTTGLDVAEQETVWL